MHPAALSGGALEVALAGSCEPAVSVGDNPAHPAQAPVFEADEELLGGRGPYGRGRGPSGP